MSNGQNLSGQWTVLIKDYQLTYAPVTLTFQPDNIILGTQWGSDGRYYYDGQFLLMTFGDAQGFIFPSNVAFFGQLVGSELQGVVCDLQGSGTGIWTACPGTAIPSISQPIQPGIELGGLRFEGKELPLNVDSYYDFRRGQSQSNPVDVGVQGKAPSWTAEYATAIHNGIQYVVFCGTRMLANGGIIQRTGADVQLNNGKYMNPYNGGGSYGTFEATAKNVPVSP